MYAASKDSSGYFYAGNTSDIKNVYRTMNMSFRDSGAQSIWSSVSARPGGNTEQPVVKATAIQNRLMPNVRGMGLKDAIYLLENMGLKVAIRGRGKVSMQSVAPGTALTKGIIVTLELS